MHIMSSQAESPEHIWDKRDQGNPAPLLAEVRSEGRLGTDPCARAVGLMGVVDGHGGGQPQLGRPRTRTAARVGDAPEVFLPFDEEICATPESQGW